MLCCFLNLRYTHFPYKPPFAHGQNGPQAEKERSESAFYIAAARPGNDLWMAFRQSLTDAGFLYVHSAALSLPAGLLPQPRDFAHVGTEPSPTLS
jgi:hypothetical protein